MIAIGMLGSEIQDVIGPLGLAPAVQLATDDHPAGGKRHFLPHLGLQVPAGGNDGRRDELGPDVLL